MLLPDWAVLNAAIDWLAHGLWNLSWWQIVLYTLATTHVTIAAVTIFLHRCQAHRALDLGPVPSHFFRFWLWVGTGMMPSNTKAATREDVNYVASFSGLMTTTPSDAGVDEMVAGDLDTARLFGQRVREAVALLAPAAREAEPVA